MAVPSLRASCGRSTRYGRPCAIPRPPLEGSTDRWFGWTERIGLGTSIVLVPLHNPMHLTKEVATLQELSGGRSTLGVGMGWRRHEFEFMGVEFKGRDRRADEAIRLMRALWSGERDFDGSPSTTRPVSRHPSPQPEIWVGGSSERATRRPLELGDACSGAAGGRSSKTPRTASSNRRAVRRFG
jgi:alkanesulfonate monooxygenase SsuD/methylene tetrahydromethanopterin reductase-like flavin-dependent oxidoreductase (luciferase family)